LPLKAEEAGTVYCSNNRYRMLWSITFLGLLLMDGFLSFYTVVST